MKKVLITGADGFIGKNLKAHLAERQGIEVLLFTRLNQLCELVNLLQEADFIFHLAGVNRTQEVDDFKKVNRDLTQVLCEGLVSLRKKIPVVFTSSTQAGISTPYGMSKLAAEEILIEFSQQHRSLVYIYRLPNVFGQGMKPNYNSVVATFCHNIAQNLPIQINDPAVEVNLVYIDDVIAQFIDVLDGVRPSDIPCVIHPVYKISVGDLAKQISYFRNNRHKLPMPPLELSLVRALFSTYMSYVTLCRAV